jgi:hypothetical protein
LHGRLIAQIEDEGGPACYIARPVKGGMEFAMGTSVDYATHETRARAFDTELAFVAFPRQNGIQMVRDDNSQVAVNDFLRRVGPAPDVKTLNGRNRAGGEGLCALPG